MITIKATTKNHILRALGLLSVMLMCLGLLSGCGDNSSGKFGDTDEGKGTAASYDADSSMKAGSVMKEDSPVGDADGENDTMTIESGTDNEGASSENSEITSQDNTLPEKVFEYIEDDNYTEGKLYADPCLMNPDADSIEVVWFTHEEGDENYVLLYEDSKDERATRRIEAETFKLSRLRGGGSPSNMDSPSYKYDVYRHCALVDTLPENHGNKTDRVPYRVVTDGVASAKYSLCSMAAEDAPQKILLTSDMQLKEMSAANIQKVVETVGQIDAVFANGDIVDVPDRAYDWFEADNAFFRIMQGKASDTIHGVKYTGGEILQNAPIFASVGNHDVMGVYSETTPLSYQFNNPRPDDFNTITWEEIFDNPSTEKGNDRYYAFTIGNTRVIVLEMARIWRLSIVGILGKYSELPGAAESDYGYGQFIFEPIKAGSSQYDFLQSELESEEFKNAEYRVVMYHFDNHSLGGNTIPAYTDPVATYVTDQYTGIGMTFYDYPKESDYIMKYVDPLMKEYDVNLVFTGHSHLWNRFKMGKVNILQSSNVGNTYGAFYGDTGDRTLLPSSFNPNDPFYRYKYFWNEDNYVAKGDPGGLEPVAPSIGIEGSEAPYVAGETITVFSILDTGNGVVNSYYFDTEKPDSDVMLFDSFAIK